MSETRARSANPLVTGTAMVAAAWVYACSDGGTEPQPSDPRRPTAVTVAPATAQLAALGETVQLSAEVRDQDGNIMSGTALTWSSSDASVATVDGTGLVAAAGNGTAMITATVGGASGTAAITVMQEPDSVEVSPAGATIAAFGDTLRLTAEAFDVKGHAVAVAEFLWSSSDASVAAVDATGVVTAVGNGTAVVTVRAGTVSAMATVTVAQGVASVKVTPAADTVVEADTLRLAAVAADANGHAVNGAVFAWASNDTTVAVIDDSGLVTGVAPGHAIATATAAGVSGGAELVVAAAVPTAITVTPDTVMLAALGQTVQLSAEVLDQIGRAMADVFVSWSSRDPRVVAVDGAGLATAVGHGTATITATTGDVRGTAEIKVEFSAPPPRYPIHVNYLDGFPADMKAGVESAAATWAEILWQTDTASYIFASPKTLSGAPAIRFEAGDVLRPGLHLWVGEDSDSPRGVGWAYYQRDLAANGTTPVGVFYVSRAWHENIHENSADPWNVIVWSTAMHEIGHLLGVGTGQRWWASLAVPDTTHAPAAGERPFAYVTDPVAVSTFDRMGGVDFPEATPKVPVDGLRRHWGACIGVFNDVMRFGGSMDMVVTELTLSILDPGWVGDLSHPLVARTLHKADWNDGPGSNNRSIHPCRDGLLYYGYPGMDAVRGSKDGSAGGRPSGR